MTIDSIPVSLQFDLEMAYRFSEEVGERDVKTLFWAVDRLNFDKAKTECAQTQRFEATQRIALELDRRGVPVRDPRLPSSYPGARTVPVAVTPSKPKFDGCAYCDDPDNVSGTIDYVDECTCWREATTRN